MQSFWTRPKTFLQRCLISLLVFPAPVGLLPAEVATGLFMEGQLGLDQGGILPLEFFFERDIVSYRRSAVLLLLLLFEGFFLGDIRITSFYGLQWPLGTMHQDMSGRMHHRRSH